jgi:hypothetical protein
MPLSYQIVFSFEIVLQALCEDDEYEFECQTYGLDYRIIDGDVSLPQNSFRTSDFLPHGEYSCAKCCLN